MADSTIERKMTPAEHALGGWLSAALDDDSVCDEMKRDINAWFEEIASRELIYQHKCKSDKIKWFDCDQKIYLLMGKNENDINNFDRRVVYTCPLNMNTSESIEEDFYTKTVKFTSTNNFGCGPKDEEDVYTVSEFRDQCESGGFTDYDGYGYAVKNKLADIRYAIKPSRLKDIPEDATHIVWFNK